MKKLTLFYIIISEFVFVFFNLNAFAQLHFPKGKSLNLIADTSYVYYQTEIRFYTGKYSMNDYKWVKVSDSLELAWFFSGCFNGDCYNDLPDSNMFVSEYGINDTTGFIRCHIDCDNVDGVSAFSYLVYNTKNWQDQAILNFRVFYKNTSSVPDYNKSNNPQDYIIVSGNNSMIIKFFNHQEKQNLTLFDFSGKMLFTATSDSETMTIENLRKGLYFIKVNDSLFKKVYVD